MAAAASVMMMMTTTTMRTMARLKNKVGFGQRNAGVAAAVGCERNGKGGMEEWGREGNAAKEV